MKKLVLLLVIVALVSVGVTVGRSGRGNGLNLPSPPIAPTASTSADYSDAPYVVQYGTISHAWDTPVYPPQGFTVNESSLSVWYSGDDSVAGMDKVRKPVVLVSVGQNSFMVSAYFMDDATPWVGQTVQYTMVSIKGAKKILKNIP